MEKFCQYRKGDIAISSISWAELCCGINIHNSKKQLEEFMNNIIIAPFDYLAAQFFGQLSQQVPKRKSSFDRLIAAHALSLNATLVTNNIDDFKIYNIKLENWVDCIKPN